MIQKSIFFRGVVSQVASEYEVLVWAVTNPEPSTGWVAGSSSQCGPQPIVVPVTLAPGDYHYRVRHANSGWTSARLSFTVSGVVTPCAVGPEIRSINRISNTQMQVTWAGSAPVSASLFDAGNQKVMEYAGTPSGNTFLMSAFSALADGEYRLVMDGVSCSGTDELQFFYGPACDQGPTVLSVTQVTRRQLYINWHGNNIETLKYEVKQGTTLIKRGQVTPGNSFFYIDFPSDLALATHRIWIGGSACSSNNFLEFTVTQATTTAPPETQTNTVPTGLSKLAFTYDINSRDASLHVVGPSNLLARVSAETNPQPSGKTWVNSSNDTSWDSTTYIPGTDQYPASGYQRVYRLNPNSPGVGGIVPVKKYFIDLKLAGQSQYYRVVWNTPSASTSSPNVLFDANPGTTTTTQPVGTTTTTQPVGTTTTTQPVAEPDAPNPGIPYTATQGGRTIHAITNLDSSVELLSSGNVKLIAPLTKSSFNYLNTCRLFVYDSYNNRFLDAERTALLSSGGLAFPDGEHAIYLLYANAPLDDYNYVDTHLWEIFGNPDTYAGNSARPNIIYFSLEPADVS